MEDIAAAAGLSRPYVYRVVGSRESLVELAILDRCRELGADLVAEKAGAEPDIGDAFVQQLVAAVLRGRTDPELRALAAAVDRVRLSVLLTSKDSPVHALNHTLFAPLFGRAATAGRLRTDRSVDRMVEWIQTTMTMLTGRDDQTDEETADMVRDFILPGLLSGA